MAEIRMVKTLVKKRAEIRASICTYEKKLAQAQAQAQVDLAHVTGAIRLFQVSGRAQDLYGLLPAV